MIALTALLDLEYNQTLTRMLRFLGILLAAAFCCPAQNDKPALTLPRPVQSAGRYMHGDSEGARQFLLKAWDLAQQTPADDPVRYDVLKRLCRCARCVRRIRRR